MEKPEGKGISRRGLLKGGALVVGAAAAAGFGNKVRNEMALQSEKRKREDEMEQAEQAERDELQKQKIEYLQQVWGTKIVGIETLRRVVLPGGSYREFKIRFPDGQIAKFEDLVDVEIYKRGGEVHIPGEFVLNIEDPRLKNLAEADIYKQQRPSIEVLFRENIPVPIRSEGHIDWNVDHRDTPYILEKRSDGSIGVTKGKVRGPRSQR